VLGSIYRTSKLRSSKINSVKHVKPKMPN
jgi:hypothetical protein